MRNEKQEVMYSPKKPYAAVATNNHIQDSEIKAYEREQQKNVYMQELDDANAYNNRHQQSKYTGRNSKRDDDDVEIEIFAKRQGHGKGRNMLQRKRNKIYMLGN